MHTFADPLRRAIQIAPNKIAVIDEGHSFSFAELYDRCCALVGALRVLGINRGDRVAILAGNSHRYLETYLGVPAGGFIVVPLNTRHAQPELKYALEDSGARVLITDRDPGALADVVEHIISIPEPYESLLLDVTESTLGDDPGEDDLAGLFYTGGTTGLAKGVMLSHRNLIANTFNWLTAVPQSADDIFLVMAPMFHAAGSNGILGCIWMTSCQVMLGAFDPA